MSDGIIDRSGFFITLPHDLVRGIKNGNALLLYCILRTYSNNTGRAHPSRQTLAKHMGAKTTKPVDAALRELADLGLVATFARYRNEGGKDDAGHDVPVTIALARSEKHKFQTSNGYIIYGEINRQRAAGWDDPTGVPNGNPPGCQEDAPRAAQGVHEQEPIEQQPVGSKTTNTPNGVESGDLFADAGQPLEAPAAPAAPAPKPAKAPPTKYSAEFEQWWKSYPKRSGSKKNAAEQFKAAVKRGVSLTEIQAGTERLAAYVAAGHRSPGYCLDAERWLKRDMWEEELVAPQAQQQPVRNTLADWGAPSAMAQQFDADAWATRDPFANLTIDHEEAGTQ